MADSQFYATAAQIIATLLIVFALELHRLAPVGPGSLTPWRYSINFTLIITGLGFSAAVAGSWHPQHATRLQEYAVLVAITALSASVLAMASATLRRLIREQSEASDESQHAAGDGPRD